MCSRSMSTFTFGLPNQTRCTLAGRGTVHICKQDRMECFERIFQFEDKIRNEKKTVTVTEVVNIRIQQNSLIFLKIICNLLSDKWDF